MTKATNNVARVAAAVAGFGLVAMSFAPLAGAQTATTTSTTTTTTTMATFTRDLTVGSTGADVTALQTWLISKGYSIPAGATGYFGAQTKAALAAYQAANMISPAAGYFGPITRGKIAVTQPASTASTSISSTSDSTNDDREDAKEALDDVKNSLEDARERVMDADDDGDDIGEADDLLDDAEELLDEASAAYNAKDYEEMEDRIDAAEEYISDALDEIESGSTKGSSSSNKVSTSATVQEPSGADNDTATFRISVELNAFNIDAYVSRDPSVSFDYEIQDEQGNEVSSATVNSANIQSTADRQGNYFVLNEDEGETLTLTVTFNPFPSDEGHQFRLQLNGIRFARAASSPNQEWYANPESKYQTPYVYIGD